MDETKSQSENEGTQPPSQGSNDYLGADAEKIGRYTVIGLLGEGGFGRVYLAHDDDLNRAVAIKVPRGERVSRPEDIEAYLNEARILASLDHSHIVPVYDVGRTDDGLCFVVSKFIEGSELATRIKEARPGFHESAALVTTIADALHYAHIRGLVHRDIKPGNILIDASSKPYVTDFGLALRDEDYGKGGGLAGTPSYMSPEQARGEGHLVDGRSDIFSLGVVFYELLTGRRPFRAESLPQIIEQVTQAEARPPRQIDDTIPKELERICQKALSKRASERYSTAKDLAEDLRLFLQTAGSRGTVSPAAPAVPIATPPGSTLDAAPPPPTSRQSDSDQRPIKIVPKGLRSYDEQDADFFLELLPGPRDRDGVPDSIRFWKRKIEQIDPDLTFRLGLIYGPSGCGKSSLVKAVLLPRLAKHVLSVYIEATAEETEARLLKGVCKACPELSRGSGLIDSLANLRRGRILSPERKVLLVLDQFEQWLHARRGEENRELVSALRHCDGEHVQVLVLVRDDFWLAASRFMQDLEIRLLEGDNSALVDLFDPRHAKKVLTAFGRAYGALSEKTSDLTTDELSFLDQSISGLAEDGKIISVRLALFAEMVKGKPWTPATLRDVGGTEGIGLTFLEETFSTSTAPAEHRFHQKAAQSVLKALMPETGTDIKGQMRSRQELLEASGYANRQRNFDDLIRILDPDLRLITPTDPEGLDDDQPMAKPGDRYYQLTHDYLVHSLRDWLTRKQKETQRGRAELRLAERSSLWNFKPENRHLPSPLEWANIQLLTKKRDWSEPQRKMMKRASRVHGLRTLGLVLLVSLITWGGIEGYGRLRASALVESLQNVDTPDVPVIVKQLSEYRRWADTRLMHAVRSADDQTRKHLHASLALLPVDASQVDYLFERLSKATPAELPVLRDALKTQRTALTPKLWTVLESAKPGDPSLLPSASALASYAPDDARWEAAGSKVAQGLVSVNAILLGPWIEALRPVHNKLTSPLDAIFRDKSRPETEHTLATSILADYASDDPDRLAELLMVSDPKSYLSLFPVAEKRADRVLPVFRAELGKKASYSWDDPALEPTRTKPDVPIVSRIESAEGILAERFTFCQTMPLDEFVTTAEALRKSGYRPVRFRPYADGQVIRVAAVWTRDGRSWRINSGLTAEEIRRRDESNKKDSFVPVDVAGYVATDSDGKPADNYAAIWVEKSGDDDARLFVGITADEETEAQARVEQAKLVPRTLHAMIGAEGCTRFCGVWGRAPGNDPTGQTHRDQFERNFEQKQAANSSDQLLVDLAVSGATKPQPTRERAQADLRLAEKKLKTKPNDLGARLTRAMANFRLGENQKALDDLQLVIERNPEAVSPKQYRVIALARLGKKQEARTEWAKFQKEDTPESSKLYLAAVVAAELDDGADKAFQAIEEAIKKQPEDADLRYGAARAFSRASISFSRPDKAKSRLLVERSLKLLREAIKDEDADFSKLDEDADLDPIRDDPSFTEIMKAGHPDRRYAAAWSNAASFEAIPICGLDPAGHLQKCRELIAQDYRPVSLSASRTSSEGPPVAASVWHRPTVQEEVKDRLAERQARAAVAMARLGRDQEVFPLLLYSADPRLRSFIVNWLNPLGADPGRLVAELDRIDSSAKPTPAPGQPFMDAILFHRETSQRRALILSLGTYGLERLSAGEREALIEKLLDLHRDDPDSGIHGAAAWALRQGGQQAKLQTADSELMKLREWGGRRWFLNSQGQTFAVIEGPVEFRIGSPPTDLERFSNETPRRRIIPRRFAIATTEVTVEQYREFVKENPGVDHAENDRASPDLNGPMNEVNWYDAIAYCNWLSRKENLPVCYEPNAHGKYETGMRIRPDALNLRGYRLPTEAEWEYGCRSGAVTSRYYGSSIDLLGRYAWYRAPKNRAWPCGSLQPNELGLFDMLGNLSEWCQDAAIGNQLDRSGITDNNSMRLLYLDDTNPRLLRGGSYLNGPVDIRSPTLFGFTPQLRLFSSGLRLSRTCP